MMGSPELPVFDNTDVAIRLIEEERRRIARDLHDGPAQGLTNISMRLDVIPRLLQTNPEMAIAELGRLNSRVVSAINDIRRLIYDLRPVAIDEVGLLSATREMIAKFDRETNTSFDLEVAPDVTPGIAPAKQVAVYRVIQEILNNMMKHAQATLIQVSFEQMGEDMVITLRDNGVGFDPTSITPGHYGMIGMQERAAFLGGQLDIRSELGKGSEFVLRIPSHSERSDG
jgi:two-component system, NarL family, sensor histidine kinase DegS